MSDFLGTGWAFPVGIDGRGRFKLASGVDDVEQAIRIILYTPRGERVMRPEFGCRIYELLYEPNDASTRGLACLYVEQALAMWEPRVRVVSVSAQFSDPEGERLLVQIVYEVKATHDRRSLVFPFYRIPGEGGSDEVA